MPYQFQESDWQVYRKRIAEWRDRYLARRNAKFRAILSDQARTPTEQFWDAKEEMDKEAHRLEESLGRFARSQMTLNLLAMYQRGMIDDADLAEFSQELRDWILLVVRG